MACKSLASDALNSLLPAGDSAPVVTLKYGGYMNWGRMNASNARVTTLCDEIKKHGISVQLQYVEKPHSVEFVDASGHVIASHPEFQSNRFMWGPDHAATQLSLVEAVAKHYGK